MSLLPLNALTAEARRVLERAPVGDVQALINMANELALSDLDAQDARHENERVFQEKFLKITAAVRLALQENAALQKAIKECEDETQSCETSLREQLRAAIEAARSIKERSQAQEAAHKTAMTILEKQVEMIEGERRGLQGELQVLREEQQKLQYNDNLLREIVKYALDFRHYQYLSNAVNTAYRLMKN